jgi:hypothetical protein
LWQRKQRIKSYEAHEEGASQDNEATLLSVYIDENGHLGDIETMLAQVQNN